MNIVTLGRTKRTGHGLISPGLGKVKGATGRRYSGIYSCIYQPCHHDTTGAHVRGDRGEREATPLSITKTNVQT